MSYVGRFAPSPTGPLHLGSLATAVASFLHARQAGGEWLVRIEDIDPPREMPGAADQILRTLESLHLEWDRSVWWQSSRHAVYTAAAEGLLDAGFAFRCSCSRSAIRAANEAQSSRYPGTCRHRHLPPGDAAIRVRVEPGQITFIDGLQGSQSTELAQTMGDFIIVRRDGLPAYHLAVALDDAAQGVTTVVRGVDLLDSTPAQIYLQQTLSLPTPDYYHIPVVVDATGQKLSKQTGAASITGPAGPAAAAALRMLGLQVPLELAGEQPASLWQWAVANWRLAPLRGRQSIAAASDTAPPGSP